MTCIDFSWQRKLIERLLMKLSTRIRNSHKSKQDKKEMREKIKERIQSVEENLSLVRNLLVLKQLLYQFSFIICRLGYLISLR